MSLYGKSQEECEAIIERFRERFKEETGADIPTGEIKSRLEALYKEKQDELFRNTFEDLNPISVAHCLKALNKPGEQASQSPQQSQLNSTTVRRRGGKKLS